MIGGKRKGSVVPPPPSSTAKDGGGVVVGGRCGETAEKGNALPPVHESAKEAEKKLDKTPAKQAAYGDISSGSDDDDDDDEDEDSEDEEESEEEEEEENEDNDSEIEDGDADADAGEEESIDKDKLAEGFYLIEAVRNRRTRRGKREYRIKWRGWPESENTWEPMENLKTVPHVIAAYEESLRTKRKRKRKRKNSYSFTQTRKRPRRRSSTTAVKRTVSAAPPLKITEEETIPTVVVAETDTVVLNSGSGVGNDTEITDLEAGEDLNENGVDLVPSGNEGTGIEDNDVILTSDKEKSLVEQSQVKSQEAQLTGENAVANGSEKTESGEEALLEAGRSSTGARRRKSGPVRRFKLEQNSSGADVLENTALKGVSTSLDGNQLPENLDSTSKDVGCKETRDTRKNIYDIIEIIKPIKYTSFMNRNTLDICVTFLVKRSDGKEMTVDNKFLKAHCPVLLVDYYEQRLRY